jgi:hypothetical protein
MENMSNLEDYTLGKNEVMRNIFRAKSLRRKELSKLPFEKKIEILIQLQKMAKGVKKPGGKTDRIIWMI